MLVDPSQVDAANHSALSKTCQSLFCSLGSMRQAMFAHKATNMLTSSSDQHRSMSKPVGVHAACVRIMLNCNDNGWPLPLYSMEAVARFSPIETSLTSLEVLVVANKLAQHRPSQLDINLGLGTRSLSRSSHLQTMSKTFLFSLKLERSSASVRDQAGKIGSMPGLYEGHPKNQACARS